MDRPGHCDGAEDPCRDEHVRSGCLGDRGDHADKQHCERHGCNNDGSIGWQTGEGGLAQARTHMDLMVKGEGL